MIEMQMRIRTCMKVMKEKGGDSIHEGIHILTPNDIKYPVKSAQLLGMGL